MLKLYKAGNSICTQKVFITLFEKGLEFDEVNLDLFKNEQYNPEYLKINPKGVVPSLDHDGEIIVESTLICEYLDDIYPSPPLRPQSASGRAHMRVWSKYIDEGIFEAAREISFSAMFRQKMKNMTEDQRQSRFHNVGNPDRTARYKSAFAEGVNSPYVFQAIGHYEKLFKSLEAKLSEHGEPWVLGDTYSLADINLMPFVARLNYLTLLDLWIDARSSVKQWWLRVQDLESFNAMVPGRLLEDDVANMVKYGGAIRDEVGAKRLKYLDTYDLH
jgi:glutathione S-transferase